MQTKFLVQNPHKIPVSKVVDIDGQPTPVNINGFEVQLLSNDGMSGTLVLRFYGIAATEAEALFVADAIVTADFTISAAAPAAVAAEAA